MFDFWGQVMRYSLTSVTVSATWMCVSQKAKRGVSPSREEQMARFKKREIPHHRNSKLHGFEVRIFYVYAFSWLVFTSSLSLVKSWQESASENMVLLLVDRGPWKIWGKPLNIWKKGTLVWGRHVGITWSLGETWMQDENLAIWRKRNWSRQVGTYRQSA
jgi:hypothetical protein